MKLSYTMLDHSVCLLQVHICMSKGDSFPSIHGQLDVKGLAFQILDAPSSFSVRLHLNPYIRWNKVFGNVSAGNIASV